MAKENVKGTSEFDKKYGHAIEEFQAFDVESSPRQIARTLLFDIGKEVEKALKKKKMTRKALAEELGVSPAAITQFLNRKPNVSIERLVRIVDALDLKVEVKLKQKVSRRTETESKSKARVPERIPAYPR